MRRRLRSDEGSIGVLSLGVFVLAALLILTVASATAVHIAQLRLNHIADELALDAADTLDASAYYQAGPGAGAPRLAVGEMREAVEAHLAQRAQGQLEGVVVTDVRSLDGVTAEVQIAVVVYPLFGIEALMPFADGIYLTATATARAF